jgi:hypothetical protein
VFTLFVFCIFGGHIGVVDFASIGNSLGRPMGRHSQAAANSTRWDAEAHALVARAGVLSGNKLEQLVVRLQRHTGRPKQECWRFVIQHGLKTSVDHRRWSETEIERVREDLVKLPIEEVARKLNRTPRAIRSMLMRNHLGLRDIRCDRFSIQSLAHALRVRTDEIHFWIEQNWLQATISIKGKRRSYIITPEALALLYKNHLPKILARGGRNQALFEAYLQYCFSPKHTVGEQLLDVRRDKRERAAYAVMKGNGDDTDEEEDDERYHFDAAQGDGTDG